MEDSIKTLKKKAMRKIKTTTILFFSLENLYMILYAR